MLFPQPFCVFLSSIGFFLTLLGLTVNCCHGNSLLHCCPSATINNCHSGYMLNWGARVFVAVSTANENLHYKWKQRQMFSFFCFVFNHSHTLVFHHLQLLITKLLISCEPSCAWLVHFGPNIYSLANLQNWWVMDWLILFLAVKELEQLKRGQKQQQSTQSATEVRLNRALEEIERYKDQLQRAKASSKVLYDRASWSFSCR